ncbi:hypothetical protein ACT6QH_04165 [Xanthobacter sp. TB0139]|uniref:hypothetical protein n=1 Tax=Xanthobacter sp. TB0139 TaxID=3459178 RepID=UPI00403A014F
METTMIDGLSHLVSQAVQAGFVAPRPYETGRGHRQSTTGDTLDEACASCSTGNNKSKNNEIKDPGHGDMQDACFCRDSPKHPNKTRTQTASENVVLHLGDGPGLPTQPAACTICGKADWLVTLRTGVGDTFHVSCWRTASAHNHNGD